MSPPSPSAPPVEEEVKSPVENQNVVEDKVIAPQPQGLMTRRFTVSEKLRIIGKYKEKNKENERLPLMPKYPSRTLLLNCYYHQSNLSKLW